MNMDANQYLVVNDSADLYFIKVHEMYTVVWCSINKLLFFFNLTLQQISLYYNVFLSMYN